MQHISIATLEKDSHVIVIISSSRMYIVIVLLSYYCTSIKCNQNIVEVGMTG